MNPSIRFRTRLEFSASVTKELYQVITKIETFRAQWDAGNQLSPQSIAQLQTSVIVTSTGASTRIEGSRLTDKQVQALYQKRNITNLKTRDEQEVAGYFQLLQQIFEAATDLSLSESLILHFHKELLKYSEKDKRHRGSYKFTSNRVEAYDQDGKIVGTIFDPTPQHLVPKEMQELLEWTVNELKVDEFPPLLIIGNFVFEFLAIHPFQDGNGRTSRILTNLLLLQFGYDFTRVASHESIIEQNKAEYYLALNRTQQTWKSETEDISPWMRFFLNTLLLQAKKASQLKEQEHTEMFLSEKQEQVWRCVLEQPEPFAKSLIVKKTGLNTRTVEASLKKLVDLGKLKRIGEGRGIRYKRI